MIIILSWSLVTWCSQCAPLSVGSLHLQRPSLYLVPGVVNIPFLVFFLSIVISVLCGILSLIERVRWRVRLSPGRRWKSLLMYVKYMMEPVTAKTYLWNWKFMTVWTIYILSLIELFSSSSKSLSPRTVSMRGRPLRGAVQVMKTKILGWWDNLTSRTIWHLGQFDTDHARRTIWHRGQFDT